LQNNHNTINSSRLLQRDQPEVNGNGL